MNRVLLASVFFAAFASQAFAQTVTDPIAIAADRQAIVNVKNFTVDGGTPVELPLGTDGDTVSSTVSACFAANDCSGEPDGTTIVSIEAEGSQFVVTSQHIGGPVVWNLTVAQPDGSTTVFLIPITVVPNVVGPTTIGQFQRLGLSTQMITNPVPATEE